MQFIPTSQTQRREKLKKNGLAIAAGVLHIVAGGLWLCAVLILNNIASYYGKMLKYEQFLAPVCFILFGIVSFTSKATKSSLIVFGILDLFFAGVQIFCNYYSGLGAVQIILLLIAGFLSFFASANAPSSKKVKRPPNAPLR